MTVFFNSELLDRLSGGDPIKYIKLLEYHTTKTIPKSKYSKYKPSRSNLQGNSFILNPNPLFNSYIDPHYIVQYIKLAALRDWGTYKTYGIESLDLSYYPDLDLNKIKTNPLLTIINNHIHFKFEE